MMVSPHVRAYRELELSNRFSVLQYFDDDLDLMWNNWTAITNDTALKVLGPPRGIWNE